MRTILTKTSVPAMAVVLLAGGLLIPQTASATFIGDLVFCDTDADGVYEPGDGEMPLDGVDVTVECTQPDGTVCFSETSPTGTIHASAAGMLDFFNQICAPSQTFDPVTDPLTGRYLFETFNACAGQGSWTCTVMVDQSTAPAECSFLTTPLFAGPPTDGNTDGDFCDAEDGPFPEGQVLGNLPQAFGTGLLTCNEAPDDPPSDGLFNVVINPEGGDDCSLGNDFGFTRRDITRTIGYWKTHPTVIDGSFDGAGGFPSLLPFTFCGELVDEPCEAVALLSLRGGGRNNFTRQAVGALLNCNAFGCPAEIPALVRVGSNACATSTRFRYGAAGRLLDDYNNSGDDLPLPFTSPAALPDFCD